MEIWVKAKQFLLFKEQLLLQFCTYTSVVISRPWSRDSSSFCPGLDLGLETWSPRSRSWSQDSMLGAYACSTITVICGTFKRVLCHQLESMQPVLWSRDHGLETRMHSSWFCPGLRLETWSPRSRSWSRDLKTQVSVLVSRPKKRSWKQHWHIHVDYIIYVHFMAGRLLAIWCSGNALILINAVALHRARLVVGWVTAFGQVNCLIM